MTHANSPVFSVPAGIFGPSFRLVEAIVALVKKLFKRIIIASLTFLAAPVQDEFSFEEH
jgi:hypothetical protein